jgi:AraC-like DNA-binding protein
MEYREYPAGPALAPFVDRFWTLTGSAAEMAGEVQPVLPDGRPELIIHLGEPFERAGSSGAFERQAPLLFAGQLTGQLLLRPTGAAAVLGVRFHACGAAAFLDVPQHRLAGLTPALDDLSTPLARAIDPVRSMTDCPAHAVRDLRQVLERVMDPDAVDPRIQAAASLLTASVGSIPVAQAAARTGVSRRHLERRFLDLVGISPKRLSRITRFQAALQALQTAGGDGSGAATAAAFGYADQPHFIREFRELAGCTPSAHLLQQAALTGFFITGSRSSIP